MICKPTALTPPAFLRGLWLGALAVTFALAQTGMVAARGAPESFADLAEQVSPAVVNITTTTVVARTADRGLKLPEGSPFNDFFRDFMDRNSPDGAPPERGQALGSGFVISADGYIVTNNHVIDGADAIEIEFFSGARLKAVVVGTDPKTDLAVLKVDSAAPLAFVPFGDSDTERVGDWVLAVGNPLGQGFSVSAGIISARGRSLQGTYDDYIQTDAAINRGNSGGPLFNMRGEVIGVNTAILSPNGGSIGIGFAQASNVVSKVVAQLRDFGETRRGWLGVKIQDITPDIAEAMGLENAAGALVTDVPEGPARDAGLQTNDIITAFDGAEVRDIRDLVRRVGDAEVGRAVPVEVLRDGRRERLQVTLGRRETAEGTADANGGRKGAEAAPKQTLLGMTLQVPTPDEREAAGLPAGSTGLLVVSIAADSDAAGKGLRPGDVLVEAAQQALTTPADLSRRIDEAKAAGRKSLLLLVRRAGESRFVALNID